MPCEIRSKCCELARDELNLALLSVNLKAYLLKIKLNWFTYLLSVND